MSESLSELSELELLEVESLRAPWSLSMVTGFVVVGWVFTAGDGFGGAEEQLIVARNGADGGRGQSSLSRPIIGKLAKVDGAIAEGCTGELKFCVFLVRLEKDLNIYNSNVNYFQSISTLRTSFHDH